MRLFSLILNYCTLSFIGFLLLLSSCKENDNPPVSDFKPTPYEIEIPYAFPTKLNIPADNPMTVEGVALGRYLFYDGRLSGRTHPDSLMSCSSCHIQQNNFEPGIDNPHFVGGFVHGLNGQQTHHVVLPLINLVWNSSGYGWNGSFFPDNENPNFRNIEDIVRASVLAPDEMYGDTNRVKALFQSLDGYPELFFKAFGSQTITFKNIEKAIAQFVRSFVSADAKIDRYLKGEVQLSQSELNGFILFTTEEGADCFHCHGGFGNPLFTTHLFYNNGKDTIFDDPLDRFAITNDPMHKGAYKAPTLRNISLSGPYMHDGRFSTLDEVINFYSHHVKLSEQVDPLMHHVLRGGVQLTPSEKADLKAFIATLHDENFLTNPAYSKPEKFPDED
ncbi:MAG: cytochrome-c peroxidase [Bacteroidetes bacterium]|nr:cytochrome-c peroxidase [Bacteroidota bacterium]MBU1578463.1 cytochrome-c peroxidase [Bacteroidota bacterium]MBU2558971.1 cytochrome-c peroxidase [Bacteroidota bacterium]